MNNFYLKKYHLTYNGQYGFRHRSFTVDLLTYVDQLQISVIKQYAENKVVALNILKTLDHVWYNALLISALTCHFTGYHYPGLGRRCVIIIPTIFRTLLLDKQLTHEPQYPGRDGRCVISRPVF